MANRKSLNRQNRKMTLKSEIPSGLYKVASFIVITLNLEFNSYVPKEETFPIPLRNIDVTRTTYSNLDLIQAKRIDDFWNSEEKSLRFMDWFHKSCSVERGTSQRTKVVQEETDKCFKRLRDGITSGRSMDQSQQSSAKVRKTTVGRTKRQSSRTRAE